eukprot:GFYU01007327.1.p1 GENE.GFYU01007327.1~~GFYU01007327.1.p1  ORF type:complete len:341 (-),score=42.31 GFYU01007327.1:149-1171(-)
MRRFGKNPLKRAALSKSSTSGTSAGSSTGGVSRTVSGPDTTTVDGDIFSEIPSDVQVALQFLRQTFPKEFQTTTVEENPDVQNTPEKRKSTSSGTKADGASTPTQSELATKPQKAQERARKKARFARAYASDVPPIILRSQLYGAVVDKTSVDKEIHSMCLEGTIRMFKLKAGQDDVALVYLEDYLKSFEQLCKERIHAMPDSGIIFEKFVGDVLQTQDLWISSSKLFSYYNDVEDLDRGIIIRELSRAGLLVVRNDSSYWFAIPNAGSFLTSWSNGRQEVIRILKRQKFNEILFSDLKRKQLQMSVLSMTFHVRDLVGADMLETTKTNCGDLLRYTGPQ